MIEMAHSSVMSLSFIHISYIHRLHNMKVQANSKFVGPDQLFPELLVSLQLTWSTPFGRNSIEIYALRMLY